MSNRNQRWKPWEEGILWSQTELFAQDGMILAKQECKDVGKMMAAVEASVQAHLRGFDNPQGAVAKVPAIVK